MQIRISIFFLLHIAFCLGILILGGFIFHTRYCDYKNFTETRLELSVVNAADNIRASNDEWFEEHQGYYWGYKRYVDSLIALKIHQVNIESFLENLDGLKSKYQEQTALEMGRASLAFRKKAMMQQLRYLQDDIPYFSEKDSSENWLIYEHSNLKREEFRLLISRTKAIIAICDNVITIGYLSGPDCCWFNHEFTPVIQMENLNPSVGDSIRADIMFGRNHGYSFKSRSFELNGQPLTSQLGIAPFRQYLSKSGVYPLHVVAKAQCERSDSIKTYEKMFYLKVKE